VQASRTEVGRVREACGCSNSQHARSIFNARKTICDFNSSWSYDLRHHESGARKLGLRFRPIPPRSRRTATAIEAPPAKLRQFEQVGLHRPKTQLCGRFTLTRAEVRPLQAGFDSGSNVAFANRLALVGV